MEAFEAKSQLNNQQLTDLQFISDLSINNDELVQAFAQELEDLVISCRDEGFDREIQRHSFAITVEDQVKQTIDEELQHIVVKEAVNEALQRESSCEIGEKNDGNQLVNENTEQNDLKKVLEEDPTECRVLEERRVGESGIECDNHEKKVDVGDNVEVLELKDDDLKERNEIEIIDGDVSSEIGVCENNDDEWTIEDGNDGEFGNEQDLENESEIAGWEGSSGSVTVPDAGRLKSYHYPLRPDAEDCSYYMRTSMCKYGSNCKFNHPLRRRNQPTKETKKHKEENVERPGQQIECKFFLSTGSCKYGKTCKFTHTRRKSAITSVIEYNFLGLPIRPGEKECPFYMHKGSCKYGPKCRFNHPDPTAVGNDTHAPTTYRNDGPVLQNPAQQNMPPMFSAPRTPDPNAAFVPMMYSPPQNMHPPNPDWNGYQAPAPIPVPTHVYPNPSSERGLPIPPAFFLNNPPTDTNLYTHHQPVSYYPERPGQPDCSYFMKTGGCKYKAGCKFNHPKSRITQTTPGPSVLSDKGLPSRPDQSVCSHYSRYGICKYGPACKYDHPVNYSNSGEDGPLIQPV